MFDVCIVGAGAAGLSAAITLSKTGKSIVVLDSNEKAGKKLYATGNGRCNLTNEYMEYENCYHSENEKYVEFLKNVMSDEPNKTVVDFYSTLGISTVSKEGYVYPKSLQASSVVWAMLDGITDNTSIKYKSRVQSISPENGMYCVNTSKETIKAKTVILACGSNAYESLGGSKSGYELASMLGHKVIKVRPALCGVKIKENIDSISGVRTNAKVTLVVDNQAIFEENGEVQFTKDSLSGIVIFNLSSLAGKALDEHKNVKVRINLLSDIEHSNIKYTSNRNLLGILNGYINDKLAGYIINKNNWNAKSKDIEELNKILPICENEMRTLEFEVVNVCDWEHAQVCAGGVDLDEIDGNTMESRLNKNLYIIGELLDIDGKCGGYNLTFAILSGIKAGEHICCE